MKAALLDRLVALRAAKQPVAHVADLVFGLHSLVTQDTVEGDAGLDSTRLAEIRGMLGRDDSGLLEQGDSRLFVTSHNPPPRLMIVGAVHIAQALAPMARLAGYGVTIIDPRSAFADPDRFPGLTLNSDWPDEALAALGPDSRSAIVTLTHDPKLDDPALDAALNSPAFYIGALGSKKTQAARVERLRAAGFTDQAIARIHGPIGLRLGGRGAAEIAISILAQMTAVRFGAQP